MQSRNGNVIVIRSECYIMAICTTVVSVSKGQFRIQTHCCPDIAGVLSSKRQSNETKESHTDKSLLIIGSAGGRHYYKMKSI